jgi:hypothetical protein
MRALCPDKGSAPTAILILGMGGLRRPQVVSPDENEGDLRPGIIPDLYHHIIGVAKTRGRLICEGEEVEWTLGCLEMLGGHFFGRLRALRFRQGIGLRRVAVEGPFSVWA